jgi:hypothetical protein
MLADISYTNQAITLLNDVGSFNIVRRGEGITTYYRGEGDNFMGRAEMLLDSHIFPVLALFSEVDLYHTWISQIKSYRLLAEPSPFRKLVHY